MVEFTLFEIHLDGAEFTANAPYSKGESPEDTDEFGGFSLGRGEDEGESTESGDGGSSPVAAVLGFVALALVVVALRRVLGGSGEPVLDDAVESDAEGRRSLRSVF